MNSVVGRRSSLLRSGFVSREDMKRWAAEDMGQVSTLPRDMDHHMNLYYSDAGPLQWDPFETKARAPETYRPVPQEAYNVNIDGRAPSRKFAMTTDPVPADGSAPARPSPSADGSGGVPAPAPGGSWWDIEWSQGNATKTGLVLAYLFLAVFARMR